jgi:hypothetical protein
MAIKQVELPLYNFKGEEPEIKVIIKDFSGRMDFAVYGSSGEIVTQIECYFDDVERAWKAVKRL